MSDTPRTDEVVFDPAGSFIEQYVVPSDFARQLEHELNEAKKDSERLDWLFEHIIDEWTGYGGKFNSVDSRQAIDAAMEDDK